MIGVYDLIIHILHDAVSHFCIFIFIRHIIMVYW